MHTREREIDLLSVDELDAMSGGTWRSVANPTLPGKPTAPRLYGAP
jgi:hypothetical protein